MKLKFGMIVVDGRGKLGGHVLSKNRSGAYARTKVTPTNPQTSFQSAVRSIFASLSQAWSGLTASVRLQWDGAVSQWTSTDIFGDIRKPTGKNLYLRLNAVAGQAGYPAIPTPPAKAQMIEGVITAVAYDSAIPSVTLTDAVSDASITYSVFATPPLSQGTGFIKNRLRFIGNFLSTAPVPADLGDDYVAKFGAGNAGDNIHFGFQKVLSNGQTSPMQTVKAVVT